MNSYSKYDEAHALIQSIDDDHRGLILCPVDNTFVGNQQPYVLQEYKMFMEERGLQGPNGFGYPLMIPMECYKKVDLKKLCSNWEDAIDYNGFQTNTIDTAKKMLQFYKNLDKEFANHASTDISKKSS